MSNLHAAHYADAMVRVDAPLIRNESIAENTYLLRVAAPEIARSFRPGQFVMIRMTGVNAPLIGRAFAIYDVHAGADGQPESIDLIYLRKGALTLPLSEAPVGTMVTVWGPLGNGFDDRPCDRLIMAVGGIGQTPMLAAGRDARQRGSEGRAARVPDVLADRLQSLQSESPETRIRVITCGPEIMMEKSAEVCERLGVDCQVSMETPMACGIGICFSCVAKVKQDDGEWDYKRTCVEGPIFDACKIVWD